MQHGPKNTLGEQGYFLTNISMTSITSSGETTAIQKHMTPLKLSEGQYWGPRLWLFVVIELSLQVIIET